MKKQEKQMCGFDSELNTIIHRFGVCNPEDAFCVCRCGAKVVNRMTLGKNFARGRK